MSNYNALTSGLNNRTRFNRAGARRVIFVAADDIYHVTTQSGDTVTKVQLNAGKKFHLFDSLENITFQQQPTRSKNGTLYNITLGFNSTVQTIEKNRLFDQLGNNDLVAIIQDKMNRWWIAGLDQPLKMQTTDQKIDDDNNSYNIKLTTQQRERAKVMGDSWVNDINNLPFSQMLDGANGFGIPVNIIVNSPNVSNTPPQYNQQNQVVQPPTGYVIQRTDGEIMAVPGRVVKLPTSGVNGQNHLIKDSVGTAYDSPITIDGNGNLVDGAATCRIKSDYGAITVTYSEGHWLVKNFVN